MQSRKGDIELEFDNSFSIFLYEFMLTVFLSNVLIKASWKIYCCAHALVTQFCKTTFYLITFFFR